jgi:hypothetical protein
VAEALDLISYEAYSKAIRGQTGALSADEAAEAPAGTADAPHGESVEIWTDEDFGVVSAHPLPRTIFVEPIKPTFAAEPDDGAGAYPDEEYPDEAPVLRSSQMLPIGEVIRSMQIGQEPPRYITPD